MARRWHMNGRIYDPVLGRFMTADQVIDDLFSTQGLNRYGYVHNNPLAYTDPLGQFSIRKVLTAITGFLTGGVFLMLPPVQNFLAEHRWAQMIIQIAAAATGNPYVAAITSAYLAGVNGGDVGDMFKAAALMDLQSRPTEMRRRQQNISLMPRVRCLRRAACISTIELTVQRRLSWGDQ